MAYDPNDPADTAIVDKIVKDAMEVLRDEHETEIQGLKDKNSELLVKIRKARAEGGNEGSAQLVALENELSETSGKLRKAESDLRAATRDLQTAKTERDALNTNLTQEREVSRIEFVNNRLTAELVGANVAPQFLDDLTVSLARQVQVKDENGARMAVVGEKSLGDFIKDWSQGDKGKHYVTAPANGGGGTQNPGSPQGGAKKITQMSLDERTSHYNAVGKSAFEAQLAAEQAAPKT